MSGLIGINLGRAVECIAGFHIISLLTVEIEQLQKRGAVVSFAVRSIKLVGKEFEHLNRRTMAGNYVLHH